VDEIGPETSQYNAMDEKRYHGLYPLLLCRYGTPVRYLLEIKHFSSRDFWNLRTNLNFPTKITADPPNHQNGQTNDAAV
jgi:hypothetical protein